MTTLDELTSWRVAAIEGGLPETVRSDRWQPLRAGVVNLWEYDSAEVWYADGRMQLQGANESGKSTLMTLTTLLLLAGEISSHNVDTLGQNDKRFRYYVEPTDHALDRRDTSAQKNRGWAWLEFGRGTEFFTLLLFAETRRADANITVSWCTLTGQTRVRVGLSLTTTGFVADPGRFKEVPGFTVHPTGTAYRETIARVLYDSDEAWLNQLNRILRVVRTPQIGHKIDLRFLTQSFRTALPPIAQDEVNQLADGWEQLQRLRDERDEADQALAAVADFSRRSWRPWADAVIRSAADPVTAAASALTQITRDENSARETVTTLTREKEDLDKQHAEEEEAQRLATAERETLREQDAYKDAVSAVANARQLAEQASQAETTAKRSEQRAGKAQADVLPAQQRLKEARENLDSAERSVETAADAVSAHAADAGLANVTVQHLPERDTARMRQASRLRAAAARRADELIETHSKALGKAEAAAAEATKVRNRLGQAELAAAEKNGAVETAIATTADTLSAWIRGVDERIRPSAETAERWSSLVAGLSEELSPSPVLAMAINREHLIPARRPHGKRQVELDKALRDNVEDRRKLQAKLDQVETERDPVPGDPEFWERRQRPEGVTAAGAPFWRLVEMAGDAPAATIEAALDAAGMLQAWITPDATYLNSRDGNETVWTAEAGTGTPAGLSLRNVLRPADDAGELTDVVDRLLTHVAYGEDSLNGAVAVSPGGRWRNGELTGTAAPLLESPKLLGAAARAADRIRRAEQIRRRISDLADDHELMSLELDDVVGLLDALDTASDHLPSDSDVVTAVLAARDAAKRVTDLQTEAEEADEAADAAQRAADASAAAVARHCDEHDLPRTRAEVAEVLTALSEYVSAITVLESKISLIEPLRGAAKQAEEALNGLVEAARTAAADTEEDRTNARTLRSQADAADKALSKDAQEILREVSRLGKRIKDAGDAVKRLAGELIELATKLSRAETVLEETEGKREKAEEEREAAANRWWDCVDSGLPRLRGVPEPSARHVTAALENSRAARSLNSVRNWPDSDQQHQFASVVQNRWASMVNDSSELRSKLELLGGRSVQVSSPGGGREDFAGSVELIVDSTGSALAPPRAAERLSALLEKLQADYDDELTKTIDELLGSTFIEHLRERLSEAETLRDDINRKLARNPTAISGITLRLRRIPVTEERAANDVLDTLEQHFDMLPKPSQDRIRAFLSERITSAQESARASGDPNWRSKLAEILDYRRWFELRLEYRTPRSESGDRGGGWRSLERGDHGLLSGGAKVVTLMQPFIAALHAMYDQAATGPRMLWLDEAFGGVDGTNKASMFRLLASCDLDWLIAGPGIIANSAAVPMAAIYEVRRAPQPQPGVSLELAVWAGNELTHVLTPDPADLKDLAAAGTAAEDDALF